MVSCDPSCPRTFQIAKSTPERKKNCDKAIDGDLQSPKLGPERGSATCRVWDFTQITELQWVQLQNRAKGLPALTGRLGGPKHMLRRHAQRRWHPLAAPPPPALAAVASSDISSHQASTSGTERFWSGYQGPPTL